jgi:hypothetical protein
VVAAFVILSGSIYRTDCTFDHGTDTSTWGLEGDIPYLWSPDDNRCEEHTLTRYLGESCSPATPNSPRQAWAAKVGSPRDDESSEVAVDTGSYRVPRPAMKGAT